MGGNIFEAIGRTNTLSDTTNNLSRNVLDIYKTGAEMQMWERENKIREDAAAREQAKFDIEQKARVQKEADDNAQINYRLSPQYLGAEEEGRAIFDDYMQKNAYANAEGVGKRRDIRLGMNEFFSDKDRAASALRPSVLAKEKLAIQAFEEYNAAQQEGDTAKAEKAKQKYINAYKMAMLSQKNFSGMEKLFEVKFIPKGTMGTVVPGEEPKPLPEGMMSVGDVKKTYVSSDGKLVQQLDNGTFLQDGQPWVGDYKTLSEVGAPKESTNPNNIYIEADRVLRNPTSTPEQREKARGDQSAALRVIRETGAARGEGFAASRAVTVLDTLDNNRPKVVSLSDAKSQPDRYLPAGEGSKALNKTALVEDIRGNITNTRTSLNNLKREFTGQQRAALAYVMKSGDVRSASTAFLQGSVASTLTPDQVDYVTDLFQLIENGMAMRSVLGAGQGSDELRAAIRATIPGAATPTKKFAGVQLDKFEQVINRLSAGIPKVPLRKDVGKTQTSHTTNVPSFNVWIIEARKANKGVPDSELKDYYQKKYGER